MSLPQQDQRILCLWFPDWSLQHLLASQPSLVGKLVILVRQTKQGDFVDQANRLAWRRGIRPGMPATEAQTYVRKQDSLVLNSVDVAADRAGLIKLALRCERFSFRIGLEDGERPESLLMDVTGIAHFFNGENSLAEQLWQELRSQQYQGKIAIANSIGMAWAVAHSLKKSQPWRVIPSDDHPARERLPLEGLRLSQATLSKLKRLGIHTTGQLFRLSRSSLSVRFGEELLARIDQLNGDRLELITPCRPLPRFRVKQNLEYGVARPEAIDHLWQTLLKKLIDLLKPSRLGTRHLHYQFRTEDQSLHHIHVRLCMASADVCRLSELTRLQLERQQWNTAVVGIELEALEVGPMVFQQSQVFSGTPQDQVRQFSQLMDRLSNRLGPQAVTRPLPTANVIPEHSVRLMPVTDATRSSTLGFDSLNTLDRPTAIFAVPRPIEAIAAVPDGPPTVLFWKSTRFDIAKHWGPERIEFGWWLGAWVRRDYYRVDTTQGERLWVFRCLRDGRWFWHGAWF